MYQFNSRDELKNFIASEIIDTTEAMKILNCSRQNIDLLVKHKSLVPIRTMSKTKIFFKEDVIARTIKK